jgi:methionyl-tRNA formyltransferase
VVSASGQEGKVLTADKEGITVACREAALRITDLQPPGKRRMSAAEFLSGHQLPPGSLLHD